MSRIHDVLQSSNMPSTTPGQSPEAFGSPRQSPSVSQYPFPSYEVSQKPVSTGLYDTRRNSTASSITSIGEVLGSAAQSKTISFAEAGNNGECRPLNGSAAELKNIQLSLLFSSHQSFAQACFPRLVAQVHKRLRPRKISPRSL